MELAREVERARRELALEGHWRLALEGAEATSGTPLQGESLIDGIEELALAPGLVVVSASPSAAALEFALAGTLIVSAPGVTWGPFGALPPFLPGTPRRLASRLGQGGALALWLLGESWDAREALSRGLVDAVGDDPGDVADAWRASWKRAPAALRSLDALLRHAGGFSGRAGRSLERALFALAFADDGARRGARSFFRRDGEERG